MIQDNREESEIIYSGHELSLDELKVILNTDFENGLSSKEAEKRLSQVGPNKIITPKPNPWKVYFAPMLDFLITVYLIMTGIMIILAIWVEGIFSKISFWFVMIALNMIIAIFQQYKA
ncbi:MAG: cation-transporting P-type ATPase, partial [Candidatus Heimdallarchaeota archaeon]|nr:cation-transporting P-type ATPase [Candidatus Heimdallarchaeota archaeon]